jgi:hypothetical protein
MTPILMSLSCMSRCLMLDLVDAQEPCHALMHCADLCPMLPLGKSQLVDIGVQTSSSRAYHFSAHVHLSCSAPYLVLLHARGEKCFGHALVPYPIKDEVDIATGRLVTCERIYGESHTYDDMAKMMAVRVQQHLRQHWEVLLARLVYDAHWDSWRDHPRATTERRDPVHRSVSAYIKGYEAPQDGVLLEDLPASVQQLVRDMRMLLGVGDQLGTAIDKARLGKDEHLPAFAALPRVHGERVPGQGRPGRHARAAQRP